MQVVFGLFFGVAAFGFGMLGAICMGPHAGAVVALASFFVMAGLHSKYGV